MNKKTEYNEIEKNVSVYSSIDAAVLLAYIYPSAFVDSRTGRPLGANPLAPRNTETVPDPGRYVVSRAASSLATRRAEPRTGLLRSVHTLTSTYANEAGTTVLEYKNYQNYKSVRNANRTVSREIGRAHV